MHQKASTRPRTRFFLSRWIRRVIKRIMTEDTSAIPSVNWQRSMKSCIGCHATLMKETNYCPYCGIMQIGTRVTEPMNVSYCRELPTKSYTGIINAEALPDETPSQTIRRLRRLGVFNER